MKRPPPSRDESARSPEETGLAALQWSVAAGTAEQVVTQVRARARRRRQRRVGLLASGVLAVIVMTLGWHGSTPLAPIAGPASRTAVVSAPTTQILPDGTIVELKAGATLRLEFTPAQRRVVLQTSEAHFQVTKDPSRPFVVVAGGVEVRAVGTAFSVQLGSSAVAVLVTEGRVTVAPPPAPVAGSNSSPESSRPVAWVDAGNQVVVDLKPETEAPVPAVVAVSNAEQDDRLAWRVPRLEFTGTPLREAVTMFNQYGRTRLKLDAPLGELQLSGTLRADDVDSLLLLLKNEFGIRSEARANHELWLTRR